MGLTSAQNSAFNNLRSLSSEETLFIIKPNILIALQLIIYKNIEFLLINSVLSASVKKKLKKARIKIVPK